MKKALLAFLAAAALWGCDKGGGEKPSEPGVLINGVRWAECNVAGFGVFAAKPEDPGMFYQWNRKTAWPATGTVSGWDSSNPAGNEWSAINDPSPSGWRLPTKEEQATLFNADKVSVLWTTLNGVDAYRCGQRRSIPVKYDKNRADYSYRRMEYAFLRRKHLS